MLSFRRNRMPLIFLLLLLSGVRAIFEIGDVATCGDCYCIPNEGEDCPLPLDTPLQDRGFRRLFNLRNIELENPMTLECDPYKDSACDPTPDEVEGQVCGVKMFKDPTKRSFWDRLFRRSYRCPSQYGYRLNTFASHDEARSYGYMVTHEGGCGVCSTLDDLAAYLKFPNLARVGVACGVASLADFDAGVICYKGFGFTEECAKMWIYNSLETRDNCLEICLPEFLDGLENNGPAPTCELNKCLQCDEDGASPLFPKIAGRTRRRSSLFSGIVRPCQDLAVGIDEIDPCDGI